MVAASPRVVDGGDSVPFEAVVGCVLESYVLRRGVVSVVDVCLGEWSCGVEGVAV